MGWRRRTFRGDIRVFMVPAMNHEILWNYLRFRNFAMFASASIRGLIFPLVDVKRVATPGP
jgi:hypothetical protein